MTLTNKFRSFHAVRRDMTKGHRKIEHLPLQTVYRQVFSPWHPAVFRLLLWISAFCLLPSAFLRAVPVDASPVPAASVTVLALGDSMGLCGFAAHFDKRLREDPQDKAVFTYVACGTIPSSWLKRKPYLDAKTACGFLTIKTKEGDAKPEVFEDTYGMTKGHKPTSHPVPKLEDLLKEHEPDILVVQTGDNLFDIFHDQKTVEPARHASELDAQVKPFVDVLKTQTSLRRVYWVSPPISGRVSDEIQEFVFQEVSKIVKDKATVIDSRPFFTFPYKHMEPDKEHFLGSQMDEWADKVYDLIHQDLADHPLPSAGALAEATTSPTPAGPSPTPAAEISLSATLVSKSKPMEVKTLLPYRESLVAYLYDVRSVRSGEYQEKQIVVMHPAHVDLKPQSLDKYKEGEVYTLRVRELTGTPWETIKSSDETNRIDLTPYIQVEDNARFPGKK